MPQGQDGQRAGDGHQWHEREEHPPQPAAAATRAAIAGPINPGTTRAVDSTANMRGRHCWGYPREMPRTPRRETGTEALNRPPAAGTAYWAVPRTTKPAAKKPAGQHRRTQRPRSARVPASTMPIRLEGMKALNARRAAGGAEMAGDDGQYGGDGECFERDEGHRGAPGRSSATGARVPTRRLANPPASAAWAFQLFFFHSVLADFSQPKTSSAMDVKAVYRIQRICRPARRRSLASRAAGRRAARKIPLGGSRPVGLSPVDLPGAGAEDERRRGQADEPEDGGDDQIGGGAGLACALAGRSAHSRL